MANVFIRNMDKNAFLEAKAYAAASDRTIGEVITEAIRSFVRKKHEKPGLKAIKPYDIGPGTENLSKEIDKYAFSD